MPQTNILIVEDDAITAMDLESQLKNLGYHVSAKVTHGEEAVQQAGENPPDLILMDIILKSETDGIETAKTIRDQFGIPVIFLTAYADKERLAEAKLANPFGFILKPFRDRDLRVTIEMALYTAKVDAQRKQAEKALKESEERYRALFECSPSDTIVVDGEARIMMYNLAKQESGGRLPDIGAVMYKEYAGKHQINMFDELMDCIRSNRPKEFFEQQYQERFLNIRISPFPGGAIISSTDVTERKKIDDQLRETHKIEAISILARGIAHDFNNILGIIIGNTELAIDDVSEGNPARDCLEEIHSASLRAKDVVRQLILSFSSTSPIRRIPLRINSFVKQSLKMVRSFIPSTIEIRQDISCEYDMIMADPAHINQILINLCNNAAHAMREEGGVLEVTLRNSDFTLKNLEIEQGKYVKLSVRDTGHGIKPEILDRIFDPYFTSKEKDEHSGMGLTVIHGIVKSHDGTIRVKSEPGKGTLVEVLFPAVEAETKPGAEKPTAFPIGVERILFVDDELPLLKITEEMLQRLGYDVTSRTSSIEVLELFKSDPDGYDLVMTDMTMPHMTGPQLAQKLLQIRPGIPIILCTGHSKDILENEARKAGAKAYLRKPLEMRDLAVTVRNVLDEDEKNRKF
jgi:CheY-like chemotaxis protein